MPCQALRRRGGVKVSLLADVLELPLEPHTLELLYGQAREQFDAPLEDIGDSNKLAAFFLVRSLKLRRIFDAPVGGDRLARPHRADLARSAVAYGQHEIQDWRVWLGEFCPILAVQTIGWKVQAFERCECV